jgi:hypothetical protein
VGLLELLQAARPESSAITAPTPSMSLVVLWTITFFPS